MIKIWNFGPNSLSRPIENVLRKLRDFHEYPILTDHLKKMKFDPEYTKPINLTGYDILLILLTEDFTIEVKSYTQNYFKWRFNPVNAFVYSDQPGVIYINTRQLKAKGYSDSAMREWEETIWHELVHVADQLSAARFDHGDNNLWGKDETAPVKFAREMASITMPVKVKEAVA